MVVLAALLCIVVLAVVAGGLVRMQCARWMAAPAIGTRTGDRLTR